MLIKTILNHVQKFKCFVYTNARLLDSGKIPELEVELKERANSKAVCSGCGKKRSGYDRLPRRRYEFIPIWGIKVFFCYAPRRVDCPECGVVVEQLPWVKGKRQLTETYAWFLAGWAKRLSWKEVAEAFRTSWDHVFTSVDMAVTWGKSHRDLSGIEAIGVDEIHWHRGHHYLTLVYQIDESYKRLLWIGENRSVRTLLKFFRWFGQARTRDLKYVCSDMWKPYLKVIRKKATNALHILDRFHIIAHINKAIDEVRAQEARSLKEKGLEPVLTKSRWLLLKKPENLTENQESKLANLLQYNLRSIRSYLLKEDFQRFWEYVSPYWAGWFLDRWTTKTMRSVSVRPKTPFSKTITATKLSALPDRSEHHAQKRSPKEAQSNIRTYSPIQVMVA